MDKVTVSADALQQVLSALLGPDHYIRELQVIRSITDDSPINILVREYNEQVEQWNDSHRSA